MITASSMNIPYIQVSNAINMESPRIDLDSSSSTLNFSDSTDNVFVVPFISSPSWSHLFVVEETDLTDESSITPYDICETIVTIKKIGQDDSIEFDYDDFALWGIRENENPHQSLQHRHKNKNRDYHDRELMSPHRKHIKHDSERKTRKKPQSYKNKDEQETSIIQKKIIVDCNPDETVKSMRSSKTCRIHTKHSDGTVTENRKSSATIIVKSHPKISRKREDVIRPSSMGHSSPTRTSSSSRKHVNDDDTIPSSSSSHSLPTPIRKHQNTKSHNNMDSPSSLSSHSVPMESISKCVCEKKMKNYTKKNTKKNTKKTVTNPLGHLPSFY